MSISIVWDNLEKTIIRYVFDDRWTWDDFEVARRQAVGWIDAAAREVGIILHPPSRLAVPPDMLVKLRGGMLNKHPNTVVVVIIVSSPFLRTMFTHLRAISPLAFSDIELASSLEEARQLVNDRLRESMTHA